MVDSGRENQDWQAQREKGSGFLLRLTIWVALKCGRKAVRFMLIFVVAAYVLIASSARKNSRAYLSRVLGRRVTLADVYRHFYVFATVAVDRVYFMQANNDSFDIEIADVELEAKLREVNTGVIIGVSHFGSFEVLRMLEKKQGLPAVHIILDVQHNPQMMSVLNALDPALSEQIIDASLPPAEMMLKIKSVLDAGEWVGIMIDRAREGGKTAEISFLNAPAEFPLGPWEMAHVLAVPILLCFAAFEGGSTYQLNLELLEPQGPVSRRERRPIIQKRVQHYVTLLESEVKSSPYNWFNFYQFWKELE